MRVRVVEDGVEARDGFLGGPERQRAEEERRRGGGEARAGEPEGGEGAVARGRVVLGLPPFLTVDGGGGCRGGGDDEGEELGGEGEEVHGGWGEREWVWGWGLRGSLGFRYESMSLVVVYIDV